MPRCFLSAIVFALLMVARSAAGHDFVAVGYAEVEKGHPASSRWLLEYSRCGEVLKETDAEITFRKSDGATETLPKSRAVRCKIVETLEGVTPTAAARVRVQFIEGSSQKTAILEKSKFEQTYQPEEDGNTYRRWEALAIHELTEDEISKYISLGQYLAWGIRKKLPSEIPSGRIVKIEEGDMYYVSLGEQHGLSKGQQLVVCRGDEEIQDPVSGKVLGKQHHQIATVEIIYAREAFSKVKVVSYEPKPAEAPKTGVSDGKMKGEAPQGSVSDSKTNPEAPQSGGDAKTKEEEERKKKEEEEKKLKLGDVAEPAIPTNAIAVLPNLGDDVSPISSSLAERITHELVGLKEPVVERELLEKAFRELDRQNRETTSLLFGGKRFDQETARRFGKYLGATAIIGGRITDIHYANDDFGKPTTRVTGATAYLRVIKVETGEVIFSMKVDPIARGFYKPDRGPEARYVPPARSPTRPR